MHGQITEHVSPPTDEYECLEAIWSQGRGCKSCYLDCYRQGWEASAVSRDNAKRVLLRNAGYKRATPAEGDAK